MSTIKNISLYLPRVGLNITKERVASVFENARIGKVKNIDFVLHMDKKEIQFNMAYVHFDYWFDTNEAVDFQNFVLHPEEFGSKFAWIYYDHPWYWQVFENRAHKFIPGNRKPRLDLSEHSNAESDAEAEVQKPTVLPIAPTLTEPTVLPIAPTLTKPTVLPIAPTLMTYSQAVKQPTTVTKRDQDQEQTELIDDLEALAYQCEEAIEMEELEDLMEETETDKHLAYFDSRYVQTLEADNMELNNQLAYFKHILAIEQDRSCKLLEALKTVM